MRLFLATAFVFASSMSRAESEPIYIIDGKQSDQATALVTLLKNPNAEVLKCQLQELKVNKTSISTKNKK